MTEEQLKCKNEEKKSLVRELWTPLVVNSIKSFTSIPDYPQNPAVLYNIDKFSTPREKGKKFGQRLRGFFNAPQNGPYMFAVSCSDECKLFLSSSDDEGKRSEIIDHPTDGARDMSSQYVTLKAGRSYFIEALSIQNEWVSPLRVGVRLPDGSVSVPIAKEYLRPSRAGLTDEIFNNVSSATVKDLIHDGAFPDTPSRGRSIGDFDVTDFDRDTTTGHHISGYFLAPETGKFKFFGACTQGCLLFLSKDESCKKRSMVLDYKSSPGNPRFDVSKAVDLEAGHHYFIDALQVANGGKRNAIKIGVVMPSGKSSFPIRKDLLFQFPPSKHGLIREMWANVKGEEVRDLTALTTYPRIPSSVKILQSFDAPYNERYNYGQRIRGQFVAPMTGDYRFVMSCDRKCELWLSNTQSAEHKRRILKEEHVTSRHQFEKYPDEQVSSPIHLDIGQECYIEALHKASTGLDHLSIGVTLPNGENEWPIPLKYLRIKPREEKETHLKDPPCLFKSEGAGEHEGAKIGDALLDSDQNLESQLKNATIIEESPLKIVHGYSNEQPPSHGGETGKIKDSDELDLSSESPNKAVHDLKEGKTSKKPGSEASAPSQGEINRLHKSVSKLIEAAKGNDVTGKVESEDDKMNEAKLTDNGEDKDEETLDNILSNFKNHGKIKIIRLKTNGKISNDQIINALKGYGNNQQNIDDDAIQTVNQYMAADAATNEQMNALGSISKGEDFESQLLSQIPPEEAQKILAELSKPKPPPKIENSDGIKVAGDSGGNLQIMEQNPFSNAIYGSHTSSNGLHVGATGHGGHASHIAPIITPQVNPLQTSLMTEGQPVTVVGNLAEISKANARASALAQDNEDSDAIDIAHAVGRPVNQDRPSRPPVDLSLQVSHHVPINHVSDYDILDLDLAGLKQLSKTGYTPDNAAWSAPSPPAGNFPLQITQEMEAAPLVGDTMASMLTGDEDSPDEFFKRGNKVTHKNQLKIKRNKKKSSLNASRYKNKTKNKKDTGVGKISKRTRIIEAVKNDIDKNEIGQGKKDSWHSHGNRYVSLPLIKKSWSPNDEWDTIESYLKKLDFPKTEWKAGARSIVAKARRMINNRKKLSGKSTISGNALQSILQPNDVIDERNSGNNLISNLLENIADEVGGNATPLDEYLNSMKAAPKKLQRDIITKRRIRIYAPKRKTFDRVLNGNELRKIDDITVRDD